MKVGFTGTRNGMTRAQRDKFADLVGRLRPTRFNHGACVGSDEEAAGSLFIVSWPCEIHAYPGRSAFGGNNEHLSTVAMGYSGVHHPTDTHFARNRAIVNDSDVLIATPRQRDEMIPKTGGGGTMFTIQYAMKVGKPVYVVWPSGYCTEPQAAGSLSTASASEGTANSGYIPRPSIDGRCFPT